MNDQVNSDPSDDEPSEYATSSRDHSFRSGGGAGKQPEKKRFVKDKASKDAFLELLYFNHQEPGQALSELVYDMLSNKKFLSYSEEEWQPFFSGMKYKVEQINKKNDTSSKDLRDAKIAQERVSLEKDRL